MVHNVVRAVVEGCRSAGLDVSTAFEDGSYQLSDSELLLRASPLGRAVLTQDTDFLLCAAESQSRGTRFSCVIFAQHGMVANRKVMDDLCLICEVLESDECEGRLIR
jgi:predicted nuclease of predicted toxin-antitoxin system